MKAFDCCIELGLSWSCLRILGELRVATSGVEAGTIAIVVNGNPNPASQLAVEKVRDLSACRVWTCNLIRR